MILKNNIIKNIIHKKFIEPFWKIYDIKPDLINDVRIHHFNPPHCQFLDSFKTRQVIKNLLNNNISGHI